ncbi:MAG: sigma-54-dependent transcriptional regulator [Planctomycetota bacterium]
MLDVLIVEDDAASRDALAAWVEQRGLRCRSSGSLAAARAALIEAAPDIILLDLMLPDGSGLQLLDDLRKLPESDVVVISGNSTVRMTVDSFHSGAYDVLTTPLKLPQLETLLQKLTVSTARRRELRRVRGELPGTGHFGDLVGISPVMRRLYKSIEQVAPTDETVLLSGPTGSGKELVAAVVHRFSRRASAPFVALNCGAISAGLIESELFGHERGAFTGADRQRKGVFEQACGGTLFLDEITEMTADMQVRLLRVLEAGVLTRVGGTASIKLDVRIIAATNRDPYAAMLAGNLRQDLFYRLYVVPLVLPALNERGDDVNLLAKHFLARLSLDHGESKVFSAPALQKIAAWSWPGNVRELRNAVRRAWLVSGDTIEAEHVTLAASTAPGCDAGGDVVLRPGTRIDAAEKLLIQATLTHVRGDKRVASDLLGISLKTLYSRLSVYAAAR